MNILAVTLLLLQAQTNQLSELVKTPIVYADVQSIVSSEELSTLSTTERQKVVYNLVDKYSKQYKTNSERMKKTLECENKDFDPYLQSYVKANTFNGRELSFGLAQIHLPSHTDINIDQATDPEFSIEFMAKEFSKGHANLWSCYKKIYGSNSS